MRLPKTFAALTFLLLFFSARSVFAFDTAPNLETWLNANTKIRDSIKWLMPNSDKIQQPYASWVPQQKAYLQAAFEKAWNDQPSGLPDPPNNLYKDKSSENAARTVLTPIDAWNFYAAYVATSLSMEIGGRVPWSIKGYTPEALAILFNAERLYNWDVDLKGYSINPEKTGRYTPAPPEKVLVFLQQIGVVTLKKSAVPITIAPGIRTTPPRIESNPTITAPKTTVIDISKLSLFATPARQRAMAKLFDWFRNNTRHFTGSIDAANFINIWGYNGYPTLSTSIAVKDPNSYSPKDPKGRSIMGGCWGTTGFLSGVLRLINIPAGLRNACGHAVPFFPSEGRALTHGDDLYGGLSFGYGSGGDFDFPSNALLITDSQYNQWLGVVSQPMFSDSSQCVNVGRQTRELTIKHLTRNLLEIYCDDKASAKSHSTGDVAGLFKGIYTASQLEGMSLWQNMDSKIAKLGGCGKF